jgi:hypothetical protein
MSTKASKSSDSGKTKDVVNNKEDEKVKNAKKNSKKDDTDNEQDNEQDNDQDNEKSDASDKDSDSDSDSDGDADKKESKKSEKNDSGKKDGKSDKTADQSEKNKAPNADTATIRGTFNVNKAKKRLKDNLTKTLDFKLGIMGAKYAYSAIAEVFAVYLVRVSGKYNDKSAKMADLYEVKIENIQRGVREHREFNNEIKAWSEAFNPEGIDYLPTFFEDEKTLRKYLAEHTFPNTTNVHLSSGTLNFVCYMLANVLAQLTRTSAILSQYGKKKNVQIRNFKYACSIHFSGELFQLIDQRLSEIESIFANKKDEADSDDEGEKKKNVTEKNATEKNATEKNVTDKKAKDETVKKVKKVKDADADKDKVSKNKEKETVKENEKSKKKDKSKNKELVEDTEESDSDKSDKDADDE